jgi:hypothetical protein
MGSKRPDEAPEYNVRQERRPEDKLWRPCQDFEVKDLTPPDPVGKFCNRVCLKQKRSNGQCVEWKTNIKDFTKREDFLFFRSGTFILIDEDEAI